MAANNFRVAIIEHEGGAQPTAANPNHNALPRASFHSAAT